METKTVKLKTPAVFKIEYPNLLVKVLNTETRQYEVYRIFKARNYKTSGEAISDIYQFIADHWYKWHFNGSVQCLFEFAQNVKSLNGYYGN